VPFDRSSHQQLIEVRKSLSAPRLEPYDVLAADDLASGLLLYEWNTSVSAACYATLQAVEVALRNTIHDQLTQHHDRRGLPGTWLDDPLHHLDARRIADLRQARQRLRPQGYPATPDRVVATLSFGFWSYLLSGRYEQSLWIPALRHGFPHLAPQDRRQVADRVSSLHRLRNRLAHHEPVHNRNLLRDQDDMLFVLDAINPHTRAWAEAISTLPTVILQRPPAIIIPQPRCP